MTLRTHNARFLFKLFGVSVLGNGFVVAGQFLATAPLPFGQVGQIVTSILLSCSQFMIFPVLLTILLVPVALVLSFIASFRSIAILILLGSAFHSALGIASFALSIRVRDHAFESLAVRSQPLVGAIHAYRSKYGRAPANRDQLVPEFLAEWPDTRMAAYPEYRYILVSDATMYEGNEWILEVRTSNGVMNWDSFLYFPAQNYPRSGYGGVMERVGEWAYVHE
jgi:hypothetical protein